MGFITNETLLDAFERCDLSGLTNAVVRYCSGWSLRPEEMGKRRFDGLVSKVESSIRCMQAVVATDANAASSPSTPSIGSSMIFVPLWHYRSTYEGLKAAMDFLWLSQAELTAVLDSFLEASDPQFNPEKLETIPWVKSLKAYGKVNREKLATTAWPSILKTRFVFSAHLGSYEFHWVLARIFWVMTQRSFDGSAPNSREASGGLGNHQAPHQNFGGANISSASSMVSPQPYRPPDSDEDVIYEHWVSQVQCFKQLADWLNFYERQRFLKAVSCHINDFET